jgi:YihY family inner membrane protein
VTEATAEAATSIEPVDDVDAPRLTAVERFDRFQRRHPVVGFPIAVLYKFVDDQGVYLAALITYYGFLSLFPLLLLLTSVLGFLLQNNDSLRERILDSTLNQFPIVREELAEAGGLQGSTIAVVVGGLIAIYGALGIAQAVQNAMNAAWAVPRHRRPNPFHARFRSMLLILTTGLTVLTTTFLSAVFSSSAAYGAQASTGVRIAAIVVAILLNTAVAVIAFRMATARRLRKRDVLPGAIIAAVWWQVLQLVGTAYIGSVFKGASTTYGVFSLVFGLLFWIFLGAFGLVFCVELNVVLAKRLYPRALLTVFTDNVDLTEADKVAYADLVNAQRLKGFENVTVSYDDDGQRRARASDPKDVF